MSEVSGIDASFSTVSQKRLRNRLSQQAFRKRQSTYIKDLERRLAIRGNTDNEQIAQLERDNSALRAQLTATFNKLESVQIALRSLSDSIMSQIAQGSKAGLPTPEDELTSTSSDKGDDSHTTNDATRDEWDGAQDPPGTVSASVSSDTNCRVNEFPRPEPNNDGAVLFPAAAFDTVAAPSCETTGEQTMQTSVASAVRGCDDPLGVDISYLLGRLPDMRSLPGVWAHEYQMGPASFHARTPVVDNKSCGVANTNSSFSDHMQMIRVCLANKWHLLSQSQSKAVTTDGLRLSATVMLSLFHSLNRPAALTWYTATRFQGNVADLLLWQMNRSRAVYWRLHANYRPSALQLFEHYPSVIDWCPFPTIRDKLILLHCANPYLDQIICDIATAYVVEVDVEKLLLGQTGRGYIRVWDLICAFEEDDNNNDEATNQEIHPSLLSQYLPGPEFTDSHCSFLLPAPSTECLFAPQYARQAFKVLGLGDGVPRFKLDPSLFIQYPELYDPGADIVATGIAIAPKTQTKLPSPALPRHETRRIYRNVADWCVNAICSASLIQGYRNEGGSG